MDLAFEVNIVAVNHVGLGVLLISTLGKKNTRRKSLNIEPVVPAPWHNLPSREIITVETSTLLELS